MASRMTSRPSISTEPRLSENACSISRPNSSRNPRGSVNSSSRKRRRAIALSLLRQEPHPARGRHQFLEARGFGARHLAAKRRQLVRAAPLAAVVFRRQLDDQLVIEKALDEAVERPRTE